MRSIAARRASLVLFAAACGTKSGAPDVATDAQAAPVRESRSSGPLTGSAIECRITRIADGDTVYCGNAGRIRLLMIDAPELSQGPPGREAQRTLADLMPIGTRVKVETDLRERDTYNRILGYIYLDDGRMVNEEMARSGYVTALVYPPNVRYVERIRAAVAEARTARRGLWATPFFDCSPRAYRAGRCGGGPPPDLRPRVRRR